MKVTGYSISCLYGEFIIARYERDALVEKYRWDGVVNSPADFVNALRDARKSLKMKGKSRVSIVHEDERHNHAYYEIPRMGKRDLEKFLQRKVDQQSNGKELDWCYHEAKHNDGSEGVLLHMLPKSVVDTAIAACNSMGLTLKRYVPTTEIVSNYLPKLGIDKDEAVLMVALFGSRAEIVVGLGDGEALFVRELNFGSQNKLQDRLAVDINRTVRYTRQQTGKTIHQAWIIGARPAWVMDALDDIELELHLDDDSNDPLFWLSQAAQLPSRLSANYISAFAQRNITRASIQRTAVWLVLLLGLSATTLTASYGRQLRQAEARVASMESSNQTMIAEIDELEALISMTERKLNRLENLQSNSLNMPGVFLLHLSRLTPDSLVLHSAEVQSADKGWSVRVRGEAPASSSETTVALEAFERALRSGPWNMQVNQSWRSQWFEQFRKGKLREGASASFEIAGVLQ